MPELMQRIDASRSDSAVKSRMHIQALRQYHE